MTPPLLSLAAILVAQDTGPDPSKVRPGWIALAVVLLLTVATFLLWMNMRKQIRKIDFDDGSEPESSDTDPVESPDEDGRDHPSTSSNGTSS